MKYPDEESGKWVDGEWVTLEKDTGHTHRQEEYPMYGDYPATEGKSKIRTHQELAAAKVRSPRLDEGIAASESIAYDKHL